MNDAQKTTEEVAKQNAAQLWCLPQHSHKEMDIELAESIAKAIVSAEERGFLKGMREATAIARNAWNAEREICAAADKLEKSWPAS